MSQYSRSQEPHERPLHELLSRDMVDIYVGPKNTHWVLHEKLLCHRSRFFRNIFYNTSKPKRGHANGHTPSKNHAYGLPDEDDAAFKLFVGWLYSERVPAPTAEPDLTPLLDLYLMATKWEIKQLRIDVVDAVRRFYHHTNTWPSLRRVQYIYANTLACDPMRTLIVACVAHMLVAVDAGPDSNTDMPPHWANALRKNGQLAVDLILAVKSHLQPESMPDARAESAKPMAEEVLQIAELRVANGQTNGYTNGNAAEDDEDDDDEKLDWGDALTPPGQSERSQSLSMMSMSVSQSQSQAQSEKGEQ